MATAMPAISIIDVNQASSIWSVPPMRWYHSRALPPMLCALCADRAEDQAEPDQADQPAEEGRPLQAPGQPERPQQAAEASGAAGLHRQHAAAEVAPRGEPAGDGDQDGGEGDEQDEQPPVVAAERAHLVAPADRRQPGRPGAVGDRAAGVDVAQHVADAAEDEGDASAATASPLAPRAVDESCDVTRGDAGERDAHGGDRRAGGERTRRRAAR